MIRNALLPPLLMLAALVIPVAAGEATTEAHDRFLPQLREQGCTEDALALLSGSASDPLEGSWELQVLEETCRQVLGYGRALPRAAPPLRVAQLLLFRGRTMEEVASNLRELRGAGVDTVFIRVFHNFGDRPLLRGGPSEGSGTYFRSADAPLISAYLDGIIPLCRELGLSVWAWMTTRRCEWMVSERPELAELAYEPVSGKVVPSRGLNIFHPLVRLRLRRLYRDLASYDIDGILFQDDLVLRAGEGFSPEAIAAYLEDGGPAVSPGLLFHREEGSPPKTLFSSQSYTPLFWEWARWKNGEILSLAEELMAEAREVKPSLRFALNLYYEAVLNPRMALAWYAQDLSAARVHPFDYFSLMSYHRQMGRELSLSAEESIELLNTLSRRAVEEVGRPERVIMKVQALDWDTSRVLPAEELDRALASASATPLVSLAFVRSRTDPPLDVIRKHFRNGR